jgi:hypothetical protein
VHLEHHSRVCLIQLHLALYYHFVELPALLQLSTQPERVYQGCVDGKVRLNAFFYHFLQYLVRHLRIFIAHVDLHEGSIEVFAVAEL